MSAEYHHHHHYCPYFEQFKKNSVLIFSPVKRAKKNMNSPGSMQPSCPQQPQQQLPITQSNTFNLLPSSAADTVGKPTTIIVYFVEIIIS